MRSTCGVTRGPQDVGYGAEACIGLRWRSVADVDRTPNNEPGRFEPGCLFLRRSSRLIGHAERSGSVRLRRSCWGAE